MEPPKAVPGSVGVGVRPQNVLLQRVVREIGASPAFHENGQTWSVAVLNLREPSRVHIRLPQPTPLTKSGFDVMNLDGSALKPRFSSVTPRIRVYSRREFGI